MWEITNLYISFISMREVISKLTEFDSSFYNE